MDEVSNAMRFLASSICGAKTYLTEHQVNYWLDNHSLILFCNGTLRKIQITPITSTRYEIKTVKIED